MSCFFVASVRKSYCLELNRNKEKIMAGVLFSLVISKMSDNLFISRKMIGVITISFIRIFYLHSKYLKLKDAEFETQILNFETYIF